MYWGKNILILLPITPITTALLSVTSTGVTQVDNNSGKTLVDEPAPSLRRMELGKAILQSSYDDLGERQ